MIRAYILNRRPWRDNSLLVDFLTEDGSKVTCVARVSKKRGKITQGTLEPLRMLEVNWIGRGEVHTLTEASELGRHTIPSAHLSKLFYINELLLRLLPSGIPVEGLFAAYHAILKRWRIPSVEQHFLGRCELLLLDKLGYPILEMFHHQDDASDSFYHFNPQDGLSPSATRSTLSIPALVLEKLSKQDTLNDTENRQLRRFLDHCIDQLLAGKTLHSRRLAFD